MLTAEGDISNYLGVNINKISYGTFELSQFHLVDKIINHVGLTVSTGIKARETPSVKPFLNKEESSLGNKCIWDYRIDVGMLSYLRVSTQPEI